ncbi:MAG: ATPase [Flavobacteriaceae bacterium]|nr:ATPase [Flavobacteriaceae bacterium]|tara:strand:- start:16573 stop:17766 length:1194 start_codon:yes stop_codon:yes gene_type:complete
MSPNLPANENARLSEVRKYQILDTLPEEEYDNITHIIATVCDVPVSLITLLDSDRNFLKSHYGIDDQESPRNISFCTQTILQKNDLFMVKDAREDNRFRNNPIVTERKMVFYAGVPLINENGFPLGTLCIYDTKPRELTDEQKTILKRMAKQVLSLFELHYRNTLLIQAQKEQKLRNERLNKFAHLVSHDLKSPLANINALTQLLKEENEGSLSEDSLEYIGYIKESTESLKNYIEGLLKFYKSIDALEKGKAYTTLSEIFEAIEDMLSLQERKFIYPEAHTSIYVNKAALEQILFNLIDNAYKYNHHENPEVNVSFYEDSLNYHFSIMDNGLGIPSDKQHEIFDMFVTTGEKDFKGQEGTGVGLAAVKSLIEKLGGSIHLESEKGKGSTFKFQIPK